MRNWKTASVSVDGNFMVWWLAAVRKSVSKFLKEFFLHSFFQTFSFFSGKAFLERPAKRLRHGRLGSETRVDVKSRVTRGKQPFIKAGFFS
jgi:hypothetical protein